MQNELPGALSGLKKGRPWMWSQWVWEIRMSAASGVRRDAMSSCPSGRSPLPASRMTRRCPGPVRLMQAVLPP